MACVCAMVKSRFFWGMGDLQPLIGILIMGPYKPLDHPLLYGNNGSLDPGTYVSTYPPVN